jgi:peroxiredoxin
MNRGRAARGFLIAAVARMMGRKTLGSSWGTCVAVMGVTLAVMGTAAASRALHPRAGDRAPAFALKTIDTGEGLSLDGLLRAPETEGVVVIFVSNRCPYVAQARQPLGDLFNQYGDKLAFVGINANQNEFAAENKVASAQGFSFPLLRDEGSRVADSYAAERTPEVFVIDAKGIVRYHGGIADLGPALADFTQGRAISKPESKAFGCTIKRTS